MLESLKSSDCSYRHWEFFLNWIDLSLRDYRCRDFAQWPDHQLQFQYCSQCWYRSALPKIRRKHSFKLRIMLAHSHHDFLMILLPWKIPSNFLIAKVLKEESELNWLVSTGINRLPCSVHKYNDGKFYRFLMRKKQAFDRSDCFYSHWFPLISNGS